MSVFQKTMISAQAVGYQTTLISAHAISQETVLQKTMISGIPNGNDLRTCSQSRAGVPNDNDLSGVPNDSNLSGAPSDNDLHARSQSGYSKRQ